MSRTDRPYFECAAVICHEHWRLIRNLLAALGYPAGADEVTARLAWTETSPTDEVLLAELAQLDGLVGLAALHLIPRFAEGGWVGQLTAVVVPERARRRGVGRRLVGAAERQAGDAGRAFVEVSAGRRPERSAAHHFYLALGYHDANDHHVRYHKPLSPAGPR